MRPLVLGSLALAFVAFGIPWLTHFADGGLSVLALLCWLAVSIIAFVREKRRALAVLAGVPFALFWPAAILYWAMSGDIVLSF